MTIDRGQLRRTLTNLIPTDFNEILDLLNVPPGIIPPSQAAPADRVDRLLEWAPSGCGLERVQQALDTILQNHGRSRESNPPNNLPSRCTPYFVGRQTQLEELHQTLQSIAICAVAGMGGIGKTELALQYGRQYQSEYGGGICWVDCRAVNAGIQILQFAESRLHLWISQGMNSLTDFEE